PSNEDGGGETDPGCTARRPLEGSSVPPNDNVAVAVAGITSRTEGGVHADMYEHGPELLGYPSERVYRFSYRGIDGPGLHEPYRSADTYGDLNAAAERLRELLVAIGARHPGRRVDLVAHSQGGVVARAYLQNIASSTDPRLPQVEHLVTFSTPHQGAPLAGAANRLRRSLIGSAAMLAAGWLSDRGLPIPDPTSPAVRQLDPASTFIEGLAEESLPFGTRALTLSVADDLVVPADRASLPSQSAASLGPLGLSAHSGIVASAEARGIARSFLRDAGPPCPSAWDRWGPRLGALIGGAEGAIPGALEAWDRVLPVAPPRLLMGYGL
ncbi:MAG TPA: hypothetical protein VFS18_03820, partial [Actinomycetota bacterium]|nr:hypothetical protein [Actinomycetota bacterium]